MSNHILRSSIEQALSVKKWSLVKLADETGINRSVFSNTLRAKDPTPISFSLLKKMTLALGYAEDYFFEAYINECFLGGKSNKSRVRPFLIRCGELGKTDHIERVLERLEAENEERHLELIFEIAEELTRSGNDVGALPLYHGIVKSDKSMQSERVAVSQYRIFILSIGTDEERNFQALLTFTPLLNHLPIVLKIQALYTIINLNDILSRNEESLLMADEEIKLCLEFFGTKDNPVLNLNTKGYTFFRPAVAYYGQAYLMKQHCLFEIGDFESGLRYGSDYEDLSWFPNLDEKGWYEVENSRCLLQPITFMLGLCLDSQKL